jgi:hypothetical protein
VEAEHPLAHPHWKAATTESRLSTIAFNAITIERKVTSRSRNAKPSTNANASTMCERSVWS